MEELIEILIRLIGSLFENKAVQRSRSITPPGYHGAPAQPGRVEPPSRAVVTKKMPTARRNVRRPAQAVAVARPIMTNTPAAPTAAPAPPMSVVRAVAAKPITAPVTSTPASAAALRKWLTPATLKQQYLLTEILQPPLALRDRRENR